MSVEAVDICASKSVDGETSAVCHGSNDSSVKDEHVPSEKDSIPTVLAAECVDNPNANELKNDSKNFDCIDDVEPSNSDNVNKETLSNVCNNCDKPESSKACASKNNLINDQKVLSNTHEILTVHNNNTEETVVDIKSDVSESITAEQNSIYSNDVKTFPQCVYHIKWIKFNEETTPVVTQNENGPCPLLALINVLLLQRRIKFTEMNEIVTSAQLLDYLANCILENPPQNISEDVQLNYEQNMQDAMAIFHKLQTGLDVNVKFTGASHFEYTPECIVFDLLSIPLHHGWLVDPESPEVVAAVGSCSYNQLVEKIIANKNSQKQELVTEALVAEDFLDRSASQLTYHGLCELNQKLANGQLCVFFRNNHFSTVYCHKDELFFLVTDQGFLSELNVVWETLSNVEGDGHFVDADFNTYTKPEISPEPSQPSTSNNSQQLNQDYLVALSLQEETYSTYANNNNNTSANNNLSDRDLALQLQEEENRMADTTGEIDNVSSQSSMRQLPQLNPNSQRDRKKQGECVII